MKNYLENKIIDPCLAKEFNISFHKVELMCANIKFAAFNKKCNDIINTEYDKTMRKRNNPHNMYERNLKDLHNAYFVNNNNMHITDNPYHSKEFWSNNHEAIGQKSCCDDIENITNENIRSCPTRESDQSLANINEKMNFVKQKSFEVPKLSPILSEGSTDSSCSEEYDE